MSGPIRTGRAAVAVRAVRAILPVLIAALLLPILSACAPNEGSGASNGTEGAENPAGTAQIGDSSRNPGKSEPDGSGALPVLSLTTDTGGDVTSKSVYIGGSLSVFGTDGDDLADLPLKIRGRGNYSWNDCPKKSYRIKLESGRRLLGLGEGKSKTWCLLANYVDPSLLRNRLALWLARGLSGIDWSPDAASVELWLNGEYRGVYLLVEAIKVDEHRVNVRQTDGEDTGFLLQMTHNSDEAYRFSVYGTNYDVKSDLSTNPQTAAGQLDAIANRVQTAFDAVLSGDEEEIRAQIDLDSLIDCYLLEEFCKNKDVGWDSFYLSCDVGGKLTFGPVWDFDLAFGNARSENLPDPEGLYAGVDFGDGLHVNVWFAHLCAQEWFCQAVDARWRDPQVQSLFSAAGEFVRGQVKNYGEQYERNFEVWDIRLDRGPDAMQALGSFAEHAEYLADWVDARDLWLNGFYGSPSHLSGMSD